MDNFPGITSWNTHPSTDPLGKYKFTSLEIILNQDVRVTTRSTYDVLSWIGDCGGLKDGLFGLG